MNVFDLHVAFKIEADKNAVNIGLSGCPSFLPEEIDYWLYTALLSKIATKVTGNNIIKTPFEGNIKRISDLEKLVKTDKDLTLKSETISNRLFLDDFISKIDTGKKDEEGNPIYQEKRMYFIDGLLHFGNGKLSKVNLIPHSLADNFLETYNNKPWIETPVAILEDNKLILFIDKDIMVGPYSIDLTYMAYPKKIYNDLITSGIDEIPEYMQYEVIKLAADMALENIESRRVQTHPQYVAQLGE